MTFVICFPSWAKYNFLGQNLAYLADFWLWAFYMRNPALSLSFSLFLSFSMSISLSEYLSLFSPKKNTSDVLTNAGIVFGGSASSPARVASWYYQRPRRPSTQGVPISGHLGPQVAELDQKQAHRRVRTAISSFGHPHCNLVQAGGCLRRTWPFRSHHPPSSRPLDQHHGPCPVVIGLKSCR